MPDNDTLLAYLVSSFPGNPENIATEALRHIFDHSDASVEALNDVVQSGVRGVAPVTIVKSQVIQADGTIPDLVGFDENDKERVLVEVKFWAGLTPNQPNAYLKRLPGDGPAVVVFLAPEDRIQSLWPQLKERLYGEFGALTEIDSERKCVRVGGGQLHLMIVSWGGLLDSMAARNGDDGNHGVETEIRQLRSLAKYADAAAFKPIHHGEEFGADSDAQLRLYKRLIDAATEIGIQQGWVNRKGLRATPRSYGYGKYIKLYRTVVWFGINRNQFEITGSTPLWVGCSSLAKLQDKLGGLRAELGMPTEYWAPVELKRDVEYPEVLDGVVDSLRHIADVIQEACFPAATPDMGIRNEDEHRPQSAHGEPLAPIIRNPDGLLIFPDGTEGRPGSLTPDQQRSVDVFNACHLFGRTGDDSELIRLGIFPGPGAEGEDEEDEDKT